MHRLVIAVTLVACGSSSSKQIDAAKQYQDAPKSIDTPGSSPATVNGTIDGTPFTARDAIWNTVTASGADFNGMSTAVLITDFANACSVEMTRTGVANERIVVFFLAVTDAGGNSSPITAAGTYTINPSGNTPPASSMVAEADYERDDARCQATVKESGMSGTVTVTSATDPIQATFDVTFSNGDHITGSFKAGMCTALNVNSSLSC